MVVRATPVSEQAKIFDMVGAKPSKCVKYFVVFFLFCMYNEEWLNWRHSTNIQMVMMMMMIMMLVIFDLVRFVFLVLIFSSKLKWIDEGIPWVHLCVSLWHNWSKISGILWSVSYQRGSVGKDADYNHDDDGDFTWWWMMSRFGFFASCLWGGQTINAL